VFSFVFPDTFCRVLFWFFFGFVSWRLFTSGCSFILVFGFFVVLWL
jgi:hypothetical protein